MDIDNAINHAKRMANDKRALIKSCNAECNTCVFSRSCEELAEEYEQLVEWLEELKELWKNQYYVEGYKKAIDEITERIASLGTYDDYGNVIDILEIVEQLKAGVTDGDKV
jgi:hypothetical protein